jgi:hypothetical protein
VDRVEELQLLIARLAGERQRLRETGVEPPVLEQNRAELVRAQQSLSRALIERHHPAAA